MATRVRHVRRESQVLSYGLGSLLLLAAADVVARYERLRDGTRS